MDAALVETHGRAGIVANALIIGVLVAVVVVIVVLDVVFAVVAVAFPWLIGGLAAGIIASGRHGYYSDFVVIDYRWLQSQREI